MRSASCRGGRGVDIVGVLRILLLCVFDIVCLV